ncbi:hypothetical protein KY290_037021 [Solanum tuberosum]|uniref:Disease resistance RPP13-like protein 1 n=1 Tax=Solanum tuberosum TaxID=4113 RepID=A0ABQ7TW23_SOLTU|nr:hypothetical protein KY290_037021 [Solanum tuberosum]
MEVGLAVGGAFLSSALNVFFDRLSPHGDLLNMFWKHKDHVQLLQKLEDILLGLQIVLSDAENKQTSNRHVSQWFNKLQSAVDGAENLIEQVNYEALRLKVEGQHKKWAAWVRQHLLKPFTMMRRITKGLLQEVGSFDLKADDNLNQLKVKLKESLKGKKFLIVLDDVWNDNYNEWDDLRNVFVQGDIGSKIIVTTRKESVALMMGNKCKGLPLALKALAGVLCCKSEVDEWRDILRSDIWELPSCLNGILPALMLSYNDLHAHLKQCFAYCAIYPKDYQFRKDQVIHLWIANGLVHQLHSGNQYFLELRSRSLFKMASESSERDVEEFLMHDLVNDLAQIASSNLCISLEENKGSHMLEQCRHMSYSIGNNGEFEKLKSLFKSEQLRTLVLINIQLYYYNIKLSKRMEKLINLRHLDISNTCRLKMPLHLSKLKSLHVLVGAKLLVGGRGGLRMEDLGEAHNLYGSVSVVELQNVVDRREAVKAKMREKNHVDKLSLEWGESISADNSQTERDILDELRPHKNIKEVKITGYRVTNFPNWLADPLFLKLVLLSINNCKNCYSLPALGQLPCLKLLSIRGMHGITEVTEEFYGSLSSKKPFNSLVELRFEDMPEWKQ